MRLSIILLIAAMTAAPAVAQTQAQIDKRYTHAYSECMETGDAAEGVTSAMMDCIGAEIDQQDARLNQAYVMVMRPLTPARKTTLRTLQRAWIKQRDARCNAMIRDEGGSMAGLIYAECFLRETIKRIIFLENYRG